MEINFEKMNSELTPTAKQYHSETEKIIWEDLFSLVLSQVKKYHSSGKLKFNYLGIF